MGNEKQNGKGSGEWWEQREEKILKACRLLVQVGAAYGQTPVGNAAAAMTFDVATIKPTALDAKAGRYITMQGTNRFVVKYYTLKLMIAAAYNLSPKVISGGPAWVDRDHFDIVALTPGDVRPQQPEQMAMLRTLLADRFKLELSSRGEGIFDLCARRRQGRAETERERGSSKRSSAIDIDGLSATDPSAGEECNNE